MFAYYLLCSRRVFARVKSLALNFGPQHPAAHGVLRLVLEMDGENVTSCDPNIGLLHRGSEKLIESRTFVNAMPYFDRLDYVSTILQERSYSLNIESASGLVVRSSFLKRTRVVLDELTRILNHYLGVACHALDVGSMSSIFWAFEDRERIMGFYEAYSGARMHTALHKPLSFEPVFSKAQARDIFLYVLSARSTLAEVHSVFTANKVWKLRLRNNGKCSLSLVNSTSVTGVLSRSVGLKRDLRLGAFTTYHNYYFLNFKSYLSRDGDSFARFVLRLSEINESLLLISQSLGVFFSNNLQPLFLQFSSQRAGRFTSMEGVISHFKRWSGGISAPSSVSYKAVESGKGEFGTTIVFDSSNKAFRCKIRSPSYFNLLLLSELCKYVTIADLVTLIGTVDVVFGEVDR